MNNCAPIIALIDECGIFAYRTLPIPDSDEVLDPSIDYGLFGDYNLDGEDDCPLDDEDDYQPLW